MKKLLKWLKGISVLTAFCGLLSVGCLIHEQTNHKVQSVSADGPSQIFTVFDSGDVTDWVYYENGNNLDVNLHFTYRYQILAKRSGTMDFLFKSHVTLVFLNDCHVSDLYLFGIRDYQSSPILASDYIYVLDGSWGEIPDDASLWIKQIYSDDTSPIMNFDLTLELTRTIQGDYWETLTQNSMCVDYNDNTQNITNLVYQYMEFPYSNVNGSGVMLFDLTSSLSEISLLQIYYQMGYQEGYNQGWVDGEEQGEINAYQGAYSEGYSVGNYDGYQQGYAQGQNDASFGSDQYFNNGYQAGYYDGYQAGFNSDATVSSIFSGILQVALVPINFFLAIFNFEILGINLSGFIRALFTVAIVIIVIKTIFGGKGASE